MPRRTVASLDAEIEVLNRQVEALTNLAQENNNRAIAAEDQLSRLQRANERLKRLGVLQVSFLSEIDLP